MTTSLRRDRYRRRSIGSRSSLAEAGYLCQVQGLLWSYFSVSDCRPVAFRGETYVDEPEVVQLLTAKYTEQDMQRGVWGRYGFVLLALGVATGAAIALKEKLMGEPDVDD